MESALHLLKKMLPGLLPVIIFIIADELWGTNVGLAVAIAAGTIEMAVVWFREKRIDRFIIFDTLLLVAMGGISLLLENDIFFKLKPGIINLIFCAVLGLSAFSGNNILIRYTKRYLKDLNMSPEQQDAIQRMTRLLFWFMLAYTLLVFYAAFFLSRAAWAFISGGLFYILFGILFAWQLINGRLRNKKSLPVEWLPIVDDGGKITGKAPRDVIHAHPDMLHPVVHLHVINENGDIFLQKRPHSKLIQPGKWDTAVGGHISFGETVEEALKRESAEEIGLREFQVTPLARYKWETDIESELVFSFICQHTGNLQINNTEVDDGRFWKRSEIHANLGKNVFTPNFEKEFAILESVFRKTGRAQGG